jgi:hypothetical protein
LNFFRGERYYLFEGIGLPPLKSLPVPWKEGCVGGAKISRLKILLYTTVHRKIRLIESNAKSCYLKKLTCKGTLGQVFICRRARTPYPPLHIVYVYSAYLFIQGRGEGWRVVPERRGDGQQSQSCVENTNMTNQSINSDKHLPQSPLKGNFFR